jgi:hypothetical protein
MSEFEPEDEVVDPARLDPIVLEVLDQYAADLGKQLNIPSDWVYRPTGWMRNDFYDMLIDIIGDDNMKFVSSSTRRFKEDKQMYTRASLFVSPAGIKNISTYLSLQKEDGDEQPS